MIGLKTLLTTRNQEKNKKKRERDSRTGAILAEGLLEEDKVVIQFCRYD